MKTKQLVSVRVEPELWKRAKRTALELDEPVSQLVEDALKYHLSVWEGVKAPVAARATHAAQATLKGGRVEITSPLPRREDESDKHWEPDDGPA